MGNVCLVCTQQVAVLREHNVKRHYVSRHSNNYGDLTGDAIALKVSGCYFFWIKYILNVALVCSQCFIYTF